MKDQRLEDFKLEIELLQKKDYQNAVELNFDNKKDWYEYIIKQAEDQIAEAIIDLATRYDVPIENVANIFDPTMIIRVGKIIKEKNALKTKK